MRDCFDESETNLAALRFPDDILPIPDLPTTSNSSTLVANCYFAVLSTEQLDAISELLLHS